jgi:putative restriction endonuclease
LIISNLIEPSYELVDTFNTYWAKLQTGRSGNLAYPFPRLKTDGFWNLVSNQGYEEKIQIKSFDSMVRQREFCLGARLDEELFLLMTNMESRETLRGVIGKGSTAVGNLQNSG